jgi:hypothetical protein
MCLSPVLQFITFPLTINILTLSLIAQVLSYTGMCPDLYKLAVASGYCTQYFKREVR